MGNFINKKLDLRLSDSEYYDFYLLNGDVDYHHSQNIDSIDCFVTWFDFNNPKTFNDSPSINEIYSLRTWTGATNSGYTFDTFGLTGLDNGELIYNQISGDSKNEGLVEILTGTTLTIPANDYRLKLHRVTGSTQQFVYPIELVNNPEPLGNTIKFCGGFYQGYYKIDGSSYQVLPTRTNKAWVADFWLMKEDSCSGTTGTTLNDLYPNNKGFFFYMGTRAENKFWNIFEGNNTGCTLDCTKPSGCLDVVTKFCTETKETEIQLYDADSGYEIFLNPPLLDIKTITNKFLIYGRAKSTSDRCGGCGKPLDNESYGKQTVCSYSGDSEIVLELDKNLDVYDNAIGFRITDDGSIGYRTLKYYCSGGTTGVTVEEQYSLSGMVKNDEWTKITIRYVSDDYYTNEELKCLPARKGKLMIYVNCKLKAIFKNVDEFIGRRLNEYKGKQVGVPFNISIGGGSQGLLESMTFDGQDSEDLGLLIEQNFAGSFIGQISEFKFNICDLNWCDISTGCVVSCKT